MSKLRLQHEVTIDSLHATAYRIPTDFPESDGTLEWNATTLVLSEVRGGDQTGIGYTYADRATAVLINDLLAKVVIGRDAMTTSANWLAMVQAIRNLGRPGISSMAISAVDSAMWDRKVSHSWSPAGDPLGSRSRSDSRVWEQRLHFL